MPNCMSVRSMPVRMPVRCMFACMSVCKPVHMAACMHIHTHACMCTHTPIYTRLYTHVYMHMSIHTGDECLPCARGGVGSGVGRSVDLFSPTFRGMPTANAEGDTGSEGGILKVSARRVLRPLQIGTGPRHSPSACSEMLFKKSARP